MATSKILSIKLKSKINQTITKNQPPPQMNIITNKSKQLSAHHLVTDHIEFSAISQGRPTEQSATILIWTKFTIWMIFLASSKNIRIIK